MFQLFKDNDSGQVQLDDQTQVMAYLGSYEMTTAQWGAPITVGPYTWARGSITVPNTVTTIGVTNTNGASVSTMYSKLSGNNRIFYLSTDLVRGITFQLYGKRDVVPGNYGMQIYDDTNTLMFDATSKFLRIYQIITPADAAVVALPAGRTYAVIIGNHQTWIRANMVGPRQAFLIIRRAVKVSPTVLTMSSNVEQGPPWDKTPPSTPQPPMPPIVIADVSGY